MSPVDSANVWNFVIWKFLFLHSVSNYKLNKYSHVHGGDRGQQKEKYKDEDLGLILTVDMSGHVSQIMI